MGGSEWRAAGIAGAIRTSPGHAFIRQSHIAGDVAAHFRFDPYANVTAAQRHLVLGGKFCHSLSHLFLLRVEAYVSWSDSSNILTAGQTSLWTEQVDETNLESIMWPRVAAFSEVFWTPPDQQGYPRSTSLLSCVSSSRSWRGAIRGPLSVADSAGQLDALQRMQDLRYRLVSKGVQATPLQPHWCALRPGQCDLDG